MFPAISLADYGYELPEDRIAAFPLAQRDHARLLVYQQGGMTHQHFYELPALMPANALLVFNDTKVIHARLYFRRETGALIEVLLLAPEQPREVAQAMVARGNTVWQGMVGNKKKWRDGETLQCEIAVGKGAETSITLTASWHDRDRDMVSLAWTPAELPFATVLQVAGELPLPPYFHRKAEESDEERYQTVYAAHDGAVAAPTAGLHFTEKVLQDLRIRGVGQAYVTLHVGAGTFQPVKHDDVRLHDMHGEQIRVNREVLARLLATVLAGQPIVPVGTTSMRVLESLYWYGAMCLAHPQETLPVLTQHTAYEHITAGHTPSGADALAALLAYMDAHELAVFAAETRIFIVPGYHFGLCNGIITNYHLPETTLILLVAALIGPDWQKVYEEALAEGYRFLSYGDSSLLWRG